jgi:hypothetical protein
MNEYIAKLQEVIKVVHNCESQHVAPERVEDTFKGQTVWEGEVQVFNLTGHPTATRCYAWGYQDECKPARYFAVLETPPVHSALDAVRAAILADQKSRGT